MDKSGKSLILILILVFVLLNSLLLCKSISLDLQRRRIEKEQFLYDNEVNVTVYRAVKEETNNSVNITASGFVIKNNPAIVAVSRDLLEWYPYGTIIRIENTEINRRYGYFFTVLDTTNERLVNTVDILIDKRDQIGKWENVKIKKITKNDRF